jgi:multidrug resistance efflux pump
LTSNPDHGSGHPDPALESVTSIDQFLWRRFAEANTIEQFCSSWLALQARMIGEALGGLVVLESPETGSPTPVATWPDGFEPDSLAAIVERVLKERKGVASKAEADEESGGLEEPRYCLGYPVRVGRKVYGVAALQIAARSPAALELAMRRLQWGAAWLQNWVLRRVADPRDRTTKKLALALELAGLVLEEPRFKSAATATVTELAARLRCDRVSIGFVAGKQVKVCSLSHSAQFGKQMNLIRLIGVAMGESIDQQVALRYPEPEGKRSLVVQAHEQLARNHGDGAICTVPFVDRKGRAFGAMLFERSATEPFDGHTVELCDSVAALLGPILEEKRKNDRLLITKVRDSLWTQVKRLLGPRHTARKLIAASLLILTAFLVFAKGQYRVTAETTLEGQVRRVVSAPFRGFIFEAPVRGGDTVDEGQMMCSLDVRDLRLEYSRRSSEREQHMVEHRQAMAVNDRAAMNVLSKKMRQVEAQIALLDEQMARATIVAPFDGLVVSGDLTQSLGAPVEAGQVLFEVAPLESYRVILQVDERDIGDIRIGQKGELILAAMPRTRQQFTVAKLTPVSVSEEGRNFFRVEGGLDSVSQRLRPGMEGFGKIEVDRRRLIWIWTHDLIDWVRMKAWTWLP